MNIRHLRIFKTVCEEESITKAAEKLFMTQPAVSKAIHELEDTLNISLFDRISRKIYLNETGKLFLPKVITLLDLYDNLEQDVQALETAATINIGSSITIANFILPQAIVVFERTHQKTPTKVIVANAKKIEEMVYNNELDLGLVEGVISNDELVNIPFSSYQLAVICSPEHPFAFKEMIDINHLTQERLLLREKGSAIRDVFDSALLLHNLRVSPEWTSINSQALIRAVKQNIGISVLPKILIEEEIAKGELVEIKVNHFELLNVNHIIFHKDKFQTNSFKALIESIKNKT
ncbi:LysR family transcriptional regulator [Tetragenococcus koreensis]|uniref:LysR family transcriptional regulator n=1 Tax=Tetragenococcus koreensis TaxID=290335 RepID=UPI000F4FD37D|nr:LysR family transcriptional regulator [Tetragenococcus koreensis]AYW46563.1 LysR family transcriptional regulator [Tetragenococcus koreensis]MCF1585599.1 LysR family transcriptional regulator [Tetragenococcus koreensis]MCF1615205.1 LysR family transcriptional regulator [Tetragenococcus koreensis]MCF1618151.1 LysR family transcriptional regulator [Tetragenococcus koreensis]MCF1620236.1 LysR family transcriptional regulator [Tetragenococcus koreensis]